MLKNQHVFILDLPWIILLCTFQIDGGHMHDRLPPRSCWTIIFTASWFVLINRIFTTSSELVINHTEIQLNGFGFCDQQQDLIFVRSYFQTTWNCNVERKFCSYFKASLVYTASNINNKKWLKFLFYINFHAYLYI